MIHTFQDLIGNLDWMRRNWVRPLLLILAIIYIAFHLTLLWANWLQGVPVLRPPLVPTTWAAPAPVGVPPSTTAPPAPVISAPTPAPPTPLPAAVPAPPSAPTAMAPPSSSSATALALGLLLLSLLLIALRYTWYFIPDPLPARKSVRDLIEWAVTPVRPVWLAALRGFDNAIVVLLTYVAMIVLADATQIAAKLCALLYIGLLLIAFFSNWYASPPVASTLVVRSLTWIVRALVVVTAFYLLCFILPPLLKGATVQNFLTTNAPSLSAPAISLADTLAWIPGELWAAIKALNSWIAGTGWDLETILAILFLFAWALADDLDADRPFEPIIKFFYQVVSLVLVTSTLTFSMFAYLPSTVCSLFYRAACAGFVPDEYHQVDIALATLSAVFVITASSDTVAKQLQRIIDYFALLPDQLMAAKRLRQPAISAVPGGELLDVRYPKEIEIERSSTPRRAPFHTLGGVQGARIKLMIRSGGNPSHGTPFSLDFIKEVLQADRVDVNRSLFFVCSVSTSGTDIIAYGAGQELIALSGMNTQMPGARPGNTITQEFYDALNAGDAVGVRDVVTAVRGILAARVPGVDPLLSTLTRSASDEVRETMRHMADEHHDRVLLVARDAPFERAILNANELSRFLLLAP